MCGEHYPIFHEDHRAEGSSPHVRGALDVHDVGRGLRGIIPACAGSTTHSELGRSKNGDHPRMCGEHDTTITNDGAATGSSPHVRGAPAFVLDADC